LHYLYSSLLILEEGVMREGLSAYEVLECYRRSAEARRMADAAATSAEKTDLLEVERGWLALAPSYGSQGKVLTGSRSRAP
jgi:hypothetical protein